MSADAESRYANYIATKEARRHQLADLVAEDWALRRHGYWPTGDGVGPYDLKDTDQ